MPRINGAAVPYPLGDNWNKSTNKRSAAVQSVENSVKAGITCVVGLFVSFFLGISFYFRDFPSTPRPDLGRTYAINTHGFPMYLTSQENLEMQLAFVLAAILLAAVIYCFFDPFDKQHRRRTH